MWGSHNLLRHHQIISLWSIYSFLTLNWSNTIIWRLDPTISTYLPDIAHSTNTSRHCVTARWELLNSSRSVRIFAWDLWTVAFQSYHSSTNSHNSITVMLLIGKLMIVLLLIHLTAINRSTSMALVSKSPVHHVCLRDLPTVQHMSLVTIHYDVILFYHSYSTNLIVITFTLTLTHVLLRMTMVLLALYNVTT